jgi:hypothetical protein
MMNVLLLYNSVYKREGTPATKVKASQYMENRMRIDVSTYLNRCGRFVVNAVVK